MAVRYIFKGTCVSVRNCCVKMLEGSLEDAPSEACVEFTGLQLHRSTAEAGASKEKDQTLTKTKQHCYFVFVLP